MGGSILPATIHNNKVYLLFGKERDIDENPGWSDFGGGTEKGETFIETACREGSEELTGFLGDTTDIKKLLRQYGTHNIDYKSQGHTTYRCHIFPMAYDDLLPHYYNNNQRFLQKRLDPTVIHDTKIFEKTQIQWFSIDEIKQKKKQFRSFYQNIVDLILQDRLQIEKFIRKSLEKGAKTKKLEVKMNRHKTTKKNRY
jgi:8-oxo-dGTP pyrophosphatase MutT (NUDIX family)